MWRELGFVIMPSSQRLPGHSAGEEVVRAGKLLLPKVLPGPFLGRHAGLHLVGHVPLHRPSHLDLVVPQVRLQRPLDGLADLEEVIFHLSSDLVSLVVRTIMAETKATGCPARLFNLRDLEGEDLSGVHGFVVEDAVVGLRPGAIPVKIDPSVEDAGHGGQNPDEGGRPGNDGAQENNAVFVIAPIAVVSQGPGTGLAIRLGIDQLAEEEVVDAVRGPVAGSEGWETRVPRITPVDVTAIALLDFHHVVLDLPVRGKSRWSEAPRRVEADAGRSPSHRRGGRNREVEEVRPGHHRRVDDDLLTGIPASAHVEVDPRIDVSLGGGHDGDLCHGALLQGGEEYSVIVVVAVIVITEGQRVRLSIRLRINGRPEIKSIGDQMDGSVVHREGGIRLVGSIPPVQLTVGCTLFDSNPVIFHFPVGGSAHRAETSPGTEAEAGDRPTRQGGVRNEEVEVVCTRQNRLTDEDLLAGIIPVPVLVEIYPGVESPGHGGHGLNEGIGTGRNGGREGDSVLVINCRVNVVPRRIGAGLPVALGINRCSEQEIIAEKVVGAVVRRQNRIHLRSIPPVRFKVRIRIGIIFNLDHVILNLSILGRAPRGQPTMRAEAEAQIGISGSRRGRNHEVQEVDPRSKGLTHENLLSGIHPVSVHVEVGPDIKPPFAGSLYLDFNRGTRLQRVQEGDPVLITMRSKSVVARGKEGGLPVEFSVNSRTKLQDEAIRLGNHKVTSPVVDQARRITRIRGITIIESRLIRKVGNLRNVRVAGQHRNCK